MSLPRSSSKKQSRQAWNRTNTHVNLKARPTSRLQHKTRKRLIPAAFRTQQKQLSLFGIPVAAWEPRPRAVCVPPTGDLNAAASHQPVTNENLARASSASRSSSFTCRTRSESQIALRRSPPLPRPFLLHSARPDLGATIVHLTSLNRWVPRNFNEHR